MMTLSEAIAARHSVRRFTKKEIEKSAAHDLKEYIDECNRLSGFDFQLVLNEPEAFSTRMAHYGSFRNCGNYIAAVGPKGED